MTSLKSVTYSEEWRFCHKLVVNTQNPPLQDMFEGFSVHFLVNFEDGDIEGCIYAWCGLLDNV